MSDANRARAEKEILKQIKAIAAGNFDGDELNAAKQSLINAYRQIEDSPAALESFYFGRSLAGLEQTAQECRTAFLAVTREDVIAVAKKLSIDTVYYLAGTLEGEEKGFDEDE